MRVYTAHLRPNATAPDRDLVLLREGFSWGAALVPLLWALWHRMWIVAALVLGLGLLAGAALEALAPGDTVVTAIAIGIAVLLGFAGNDLRRWTLARRGWAEAGVVTGRDEEEAERRLLDTRPDLFDGARPDATQTVVMPARNAGVGWARPAAEGWPDPFGPRVGRAGNAGGWRPRPGS